MIRPRWVPGIASTTHLATFSGSRKLEIINFLYFDIGPTTGFWGDSHLFYLLYFIDYLITFGLQGRDVGWRFCVVQNFMLPRTYRIVFWCVSSRFELFRTFWTNLGRRIRVNKLNDNILITFLLFPFPIDLRFDNFSYLWNWRWQVRLRWWLDVQFCCKLVFSHQRTRQFVPSLESFLEVAPTVIVICLRVG